MVSKNTRLKILVILFFISTVAFFLQFPSDLLTFVVQLLAELCLSILSYLFILLYFIHEPIPATIDDLNLLFDSRSGEILFVQHTLNPSHNFLKLTLDKKHIEVYPAADVLRNTQQSIGRALIKATFGSLSLTLLLIWVHSFITTIDMILYLLIYVAVVFALIIVAVLLSISIKVEQRKIETKRLVEFRKNTPNLEITCKISKRQLPKDAYFEELKLSVPLDQLTDEIFVTTLNEEINKNKDKLSSPKRFLFSVSSKLLKYATSIALHGDSNAVTIIDNPISEEVSKKFLTSDLLIFGLLDKEMLETFHQNLLKWAVKPV